MVKRHRVTFKFAAHCAAAFAALTFSTCSTTDAAANSSKVALFAATSFVVGFEFQCYAYVVQPW